MNRGLRAVPGIVEPSAPEQNDDDRARINALRGVLPSAEEVDRVAAVFRLMGDPGRVRILVTLLQGGEVCVGDLASVAGLSESSVSQALRLMRMHHIVVTRRAGRVVFYRLGDRHVRMLLDMAIAHAGHSSATTAATAPPDSPTEPDQQETR